MRHLLISCALLAGCDAYDRDLGATPFLCGDDSPRCPDGYSCQADGISGEEICVREGDSLSADFDCADDPNEPNDALEEATATMVDGMATFSAEGLSICPVGDRDLYAIAVSTMNTGLELLVDYEAGGADLKAALLNAGGIPIASAMPVDGATRQIRASAQNLPVGTYYAAVSAPVTEQLSVNNYKLTVSAD